MSARTRITASAIAAAVLAALLVGSISIAGAEDSADGRSVTVGYYDRTTSYVCSSDIGCFPGKIKVKCKAGDRATGGAAWYINHPGGARSDRESRPYISKHGNPRGWLSDDIFIDKNDEVKVKVICADLS